MKLSIVNHVRLARLPARLPWPFVKKGSMGQRKIGPMKFEKHKWPSARRDFPELNPKLYGTNPMELRGYTNVQRPGYVDEETGEFVRVEEMVYELIVPDLSDCKLKPYVSYKADIEIEKRANEYAAAVKKHGSEEIADMHTDPEQRWPPPKVTDKTLFDYFYADKIRKEFEAAKKNQKK